MKRLLLGVVAVILLGGCGNAPSSQEPLHPVTPITPERQDVALGTTLNWRPVEPRRFSLGSMGAPVVPLELEDAALVPPDDPKVLGWWGTKVGAKHGVTLLVGHTVHTGGGTLDNLEEVAVGTDVNVSGVRYTVSSNRIISKDTLSRRAPHLFSQKGSHRLVVVTCEDYDPVTGTYASNVVMVAK